MRTLLLFTTALVAFSVGCRSVKTLHDETIVAKDIASIARDEPLRERFEARLEQYGFNIQRSPDQSECEAQLCLDDHCRRIFSLTYKVDSTGAVHAVETTVFRFVSLSN